MFLSIPILHLHSKLFLHILLNQMANHVPALHLTTSPIDNISFYHDWITIIVIRLEIISTSSSNKHSSLHPHMVIDILLQLLYLLKLPSRTSPSSSLQQLHWSCWCSRNILHCILTTYSDHFAIVKDNTADSLLLLLLLPSRHEENSTHNTIIRCQQVPIQAPP